MDAKDLIWWCPQDGYYDCVQIQVFYNDLNVKTWTIVDATAGGTLLSKIAEEAQLLL